MPAAEVHLAYRTGNEDVGSGPNGDIVAWLQDTLRGEREALEQRHYAMVAELSQRISGLRAAAEAVPANRNVLPSNEAPPARSASNGSSGSAEKTPSPQTRRKNVQPPFMQKRSQSRVSEDGSATLYERFRAFVEGPTFEITFGLIIFINALTLAMEMQWRGFDSGYLISYPNCSRPASDTWPWAEDFFKVSEYILGTLFTFELVAKILAQKCHYFYEIWNWVDALIVAAWLGTVAGQADIGFNPFLLRLLRLVRLLRLLRLIRTISVFDSLYLMTTAIRGSTSVLVWTVLVLALVEMSLACLIQSLVEDWIRNPQNRGTEEGELVYMYFGSFARSMLTMYEMTLGNWMPPCRALVENVNEWYMLFFLWHKFVIGFSVVSVITGVFIQETFKVATSDDQIMLNNKERLMKEHEKKMKALFTSADVDGDGNLERGEFVEVMNDGRVRKWLSSMGLDVGDAGTLFDLLHNSDGCITAQDLIRGASRLKGPAKHIEFVEFLAEWRHFKTVVVGRMQMQLDGVFPGMTLKSQEKIPFPKLSVDDGGPAIMPPMCGFGNTPRSLG